MIMYSFNYTIDKATAKEIEIHLNKCANLFHPYLNTYVDITDYAEKIRKNGVTVESWFNNELVGLIACYLNNYENNNGYISNLSVIKKYQGFGIASQLLKKTVEEALRLGFNTIELEVEAKNNNAINLYKRTGFVFNGRRQDKFLMLNRLNDRKDIMISICCVTYNHASYIAKAIDGFLMQKTNFNYEILIHDDASTDGTVEIVKDYYNQYSNTIKPIFQSENQYSQGRVISAVYQFPRAQGKYIALCEGDDYWTDPNKLQKQIDFLEANAEYSMCCHDVEIIYEDDWKGPKWQRFAKPVINSSFADILDNHFIPTNSLVFRRDCIKQLPLWFYSPNIISGDIALELILASQGQCYYFEDKMGVKRINGGGITANQKRREKVKFFKYELYYYINQYTSNRYKHLLIPKLKRSFPGVFKHAILKGEIPLMIKYAYFLIRSVLC